MRLERVPAGRRVGGDAHARLLLVHLGPHLALRDAAGERLRREHLRLAPPEVRVRDVVGRPECGAASAPAALLDARDGDRQLRAGLDEHAHIEDPVLLRADELLAVVQQHARAGRVLDDELRHGARVGRLVDVEPARQRLVERDVRGDRVVLREERCHDDPAVLHGLAELEGVECHGVLLSGSRGSQASVRLCLTSPA